MEQNSGSGDKMGDEGKEDVRFLNYHLTSASPDAKAIVHALENIDHTLRNLLGAAQELVRTQRRVEHLGAVHVGPKGEDHPQ